MELDRRAFVGGYVASLLPARTSAGAAKQTREAVETTLEAGPTKARLGPKGATALWGYNGRVPGPLLRVTKGETVKVKLVNKLDQPTTLCWHGVRVTNEMDGVAGLTQDPVPAGESFAYTFTPPDSGLFWYHPHVQPFSAEQIGRGLYGVMIVDEIDPPPVDDDVLIVIDDWSLDAKGQINNDFSAGDPHLPSERVGSHVTVNSKPIPSTFPYKPGSRLRLRLLNVCSARVALIAFVGLTPAVIAIDGQPSELFQTAAGMIPIGPGSRFEVMVDLPADGGKQASLMLRGGAAPDQALVRFETKGKDLPSHGPIAKLPDNPLLPERIHLERSLRFKIEIDDAAVAATVADPAMVKPTNSRNAKDLPLQNLPLKDAAVAPNAAEPSGRWTINGVAKGEAWGKPLFKVRRGMPVNLTFLNKSVVVQQMHVHGHVMRVLHDLDDGWDPYWRDSLLLASGQRKLVAFVADNPGKWVIESLILDRQVSGLAAWFEVT